MCPLIANERGNAGRQLQMGDRLRQRGSAPLVELHKGHMKLLSLHQTVPSLLPPSPPPPTLLPLPSSNIPLRPVPLQFQSNPFVIVICSFFAISYLILCFLSPCPVLSASAGMSASCVSNAPLFSSLLFSTLLYSSLLFSLLSCVSE